MMVLVAIRNKMNARCNAHQPKMRMYGECPESKDTKLLNMYFLIYKRDTVNELPAHNFIFQHSRRHFPNIN
jgi:hypothetical protein